MNLTLWTATVDSVDSKGVVTSVHRTEADLLASLNERYAEGEGVEDGGIVEWMTENGHVLYIDRHDLEAAPVERDELDRAMLDAAANQYENEGTLEIDDDAIISYGDDAGAYVAAWVWVSFDGLPLRSIVTTQGTAMPEATLCLGHHANDYLRSELEKAALASTEPESDRPAEPIRWEDSSDNDEIECVECEK